MSSHFCRSVRPLSQVFGDKKQPALRFGNVLIRACGARMGAFRQEILTNHASVCEVDPNYWTTGLDREIRFEC